MKLTRLWAKSLSIAAQDVRPHVHCEDCGKEMFRGDEAYRGNKAGKLTSRFWCPPCGEKKQDSTGSRIQTTVN